MHLYLECGYKWSTLCVLLSPPPNKTVLIIMHGLAIGNNYEYMQCVHAFDVYATMPPCPCKVESELRLARSCTISC